MTYFNKKSVISHPVFPKKKKLNLNFEEEKHTNVIFIWFDLSG